MQVIDDTANRNSYSTRQRTGQKTYKAHQYGQRQILQAVNH
jgi:hypothetical protein